ncbi:MAG: Lipoyl synthase [Myxococcota bacterium]|nr:Lipoyl synthase [Myxococcota bacterium]
MSSGRQTGADWARSIADGEPPARPVNTSRAEAGAPKPPWLRVKLGRHHPGFQETQDLVHEHRLHTVCESAACPNIGECWSQRSMTIMILGNICTRSCGFCDVKFGKPRPADAGEPARVAEMLAKLSLRHTVITSVDRDDLPDFGASIWAETITRVKEACPGMTLETLTGDFRGDDALMKQVFDARPHVFSHNMETVKSLHARVRPRARYERSLRVLEQAAKAGLNAKSGLMVGLGETMAGLLEVMRDLRGAGVNIVTIGQYLRPGKLQLPVERYWTPEEFDELRQAGEAMGFSHVAAAPFVRSSYRAWEHVGVEGP